MRALQRQTVRERELETDGSRKMTRDGPGGREEGRRETHGEKSRARGRESRAVGAHAVQTGAPQRENQTATTPDERRGLVPQ